jgi:D-serine deaminase-like pyridoxal phosphate-dependent protein
MLVQDLPTPSLLLDLDRLERNCTRMAERTAVLGVTLRPHLKTAKSADVARLATAANAKGITVSTIDEIDYFAKQGFDDLTYAVGIVPQKIATIARLMKEHRCTVSLLTDTESVIAALDTEAARHDCAFPIFIEIDCGGGRGGVAADGDALIAIARAIETSSNLSLAGVLTHAGQSYAEPGIDKIGRIAEIERSTIVHAATRLRAEGIEVRSVSLGSTPTVALATSMEGVTEVRPGVYTLCDLDQVALGVYSVDDIAASVLTTVIGHNVRSRRILIDAGALALSKDLSAFHFDEAYGYGLVCDELGRGPIDGMRVSDLHQEHGFIACPTVLFDKLVEDFPVGTRLRILPNHACMTVAPFSFYNLVRGQGADVLSRWAKLGGAR